MQAVGWVLLTIPVIMGLVLGVVWSLLWSGLLSARRMMTRHIEVAGLRSVLADFLSKAFYAGGVVAAVGGVVEVVRNDSGAPVLFVVGSVVGGGGYVLGRVGKGLIAGWS